MRLLTSRVTLEPKGKRWVRFITKQQHTRRWQMPHQRSNLMGVTKTREHMWTVLFLIYLWRSRHAERLNVSIKTPHERIWTQRLMNLVSRSDYLYAICKIKISNDPWIASYICYVYFSKLRFFYHCQSSFVMRVGSGMLASKAGSEHSHTQGQPAVIPDLNNLCWCKWTVSILEQYLILPVRCTLRMLPQVSSSQSELWNWKNPKPLWTTIIGLVRNCPGCPRRITRKLYCHDYWA